MEFKRGKEETAEKGEGGKEENAEKARFSHFSPLLISDLLSFKFFTKNVSAEEPVIARGDIRGDKYMFVFPHDFDPASPL